jgi:hypothetical protein
MNAMKLKILNELIDHLSASQGGDLKSMLDESKKPNPLASGDGDDEEGLKDKFGNPIKPKGIAIEKISVMGKPKPDISDIVNKKAPGMFPEEPEGADDEKEMNDDELKELIAKYLR